MYNAQPLGEDLKDILDTLNELKREVEHKVRACVKLEAEKAALARRLSEALAAERRQRCRASAGRAIAKRAQMAIQPVIACYRELAGLKRELALAKKKSKDEKKILEERIANLQAENIRLKEVNEAALAAVDFSKEFKPDDAQNRDQVSSTAEVSTPSPAPGQESAIDMNTPAPELYTGPSLAWPFPSEQHSSSSHSPSHTTNGDSLWTGTGQLSWNPPPVNLTSNQPSNRSRLQKRPANRWPMSPARPQYLPVAGFRTATQLMAQESENTAENSRSRQLRADSVVSQVDVPHSIVADDRSRQLTSSLEVYQPLPDDRSRQLTFSSEVRQPLPDDRSRQLTSSLEVYQPLADDRSRQLTSTSEVIQSEPLADMKRSPPSEDDCVIVCEETIKISHPSIKPKQDIDLDEIGSAEIEVSLQTMPVKVSKKKRKMYMKPQNDDIIM